MIASRSAITLPRWVEAVGEFASGLGPQTELRDQIGRGTFAAASQRTDQLMHDLPSRQSEICGRVPICRQFFRS